MGIWPFRRARSRLFVLALDGFPFSLAERLLVEGRAPQLQKALDGGRLARLFSCYPTVSNVAWSCFLTGRNPGGFAVFGFAELTEQMELRIPNAQDLGAPTLWEVLSEQGRRVIGLGVPLGYPPRPVNGILVGCFLAPKLEGAVYPSAMTERFKSWGYRLDIDPVKARESLDYLKQDLLAGLAARERVIMELLDSERWDLFVAHVMETDRINHFMWRFFEGQDSENKTFFLHFYRRVDELIGKILERLDRQDEFMLLSDHGFCATIKEVQLNRWLEEKGYLSYVGEPTGFESVSGHSSAVALVPGRIHILTRSRWSRGEVSEAQYETLRERLIEELAQWRDPQTGDAICASVLRREEAFRGPYLLRAPDIIAHPRDGYDLKAALGQKETFTSSPINGMHTREDALIFLRGKEIRSSSPMIWDAAPTVLDLLGLEPPPDLDGRSLLR